MARKSRKFRFGSNALPLAALAIIGVASVAYAAFSVNLNVAGTGTIAGDWDVEIVSITKEAGSVGESDAASTPSYTASTATFSSNLAYPGATATYLVTVANMGSIPAYLDSLTSDAATVNAAAPSGVNFTVDTTNALTANTSNPAAATHLGAWTGSQDATDSITFKVKVEWLLSDTQSYSSGANKDLSVSMGWNQYTP